MAQALWDVAADVSAWRAVAIQHRIARAGRPRRTRLEKVPAGLLQDPHLSATGYAGHGFLDVGRTEPPAAEPVHDELPDPEDGAADAIRPERVDQAAGISVRRGRPSFDRGRLSGVRSSAPP